MTDINNDISIKDFQELMNKLYGERDRQRGIDRTYMWLVEEMGELSRSIRKSDDPANLREEMADILAWLCSIANVLNVDLAEAALEKYPLSCSKCGENPCSCPYR